MGSHEHSIGNSAQLSRKESYEHIAGVRYIETSSGDADALRADGFAWPTILALEAPTERDDRSPSQTNERLLAGRTAEQRRFIFELEPAEDDRSQRKLREFHDHLRGVRAAPPGAPSPSRRPPKGVRATTSTNPPAHVTLLPAVDPGGSYP